MDKLRIAGGKRLSGRVSVGGAKNASLPEMAASLLTEDPLRLTNVPDVWDVGTMRRLLKDLGVECVRRSPQRPHEIVLEARRLVAHEAPYDLVKTMRASVLVLGPLLARNGRARVSLPGGCAIGERPIDLHVDGLTKMGATISLEHGYVDARADGLKGARIELPVKTVTGTENLMMAATIARGTTVLANAAQEPEVVDLAALLVAMGASIHGAGSTEITIEGRASLGGASHRVIPDRIEAGTYLVAGALVGSGLEVAGCRPSDLDAVTAQLPAAGVAIEARGDSLFVSAPATLEARDLSTAPHPGFPTDMQAQYMTLMTQARGASAIAETIFERRFMHVGELQRMGADIRIDGGSAHVRGPRSSRAPRSWRPT